MTAASAAAAAAAKATKAPAPNPPPTYDHPEYAFQFSSTVFCFLFFGACLVVWFFLSFVNRDANRDRDRDRDDDREELDSEDERIELKADIVDHEKAAKMGDKARDSRQNAKNQPKNKKKHLVQPVEATKASLTLLASQLTQFGGILMYSWFCENMPVFEHANKHYSRDIFWFVTFIYLGFALTTVKGNPKDTSLLNREQTEEWKGWMQFLFLAYHYFHASEVYNSIRVFISCYVWMTGFGNFSFFYIKQDFGFVRFAQMMWRLNFLVFWLMMAHGNTFILYYINPLHTFYFLMVYAVMYVCSSYNHQKNPIRVKVMVSALIIFLIWDVPGVFDIVWRFLPTESVIGAKNGVRHEWHFRSGLDHYSALFGMIFAMNYPMAQEWFVSVERLGSWKQWCMKGIMLLTMFVVMGFWVNNVFLLNKFKYNEHHAYYFWVPLLSYIFVRNCSLTLRSYHLGLLTSMGKITLETYLMQHHIWLTSNAKTLLVFIPNAPMVNFLCVSCVYLLLSHKLFRLTVSLRAQLVPNDLNKALWLLATMYTTLSFIYALALLCTFLGGGFAVVFSMALLLGGGFYCILREITDNPQEAIYRIRKPYLAVTGVIGSSVLMFNLISFLNHALIHIEPQTKHTGGVAQSWPLGVMCVIIAGICVVLFDSFVGVSYIVTYAGFERMPDWESTYSVLHKKIAGGKSSSSFSSSSMSKRNKILEG